MYDKNRCRLLERNSNNLLRETNYIDTKVFDIEDYKNEQSITTKDFKKLKNRYYIKCQNMQTFENNQFNNIFFDDALSQIIYFIDEKGFSPKKIFNKFLKYKSKVCKSEKCIFKKIAENGFDTLKIDDINYYIIDSNKELAIFDDKKYIYYDKFKLRIDTSLERIK